VLAASLLNAAAVIGLIATRTTFLYLFFIALLSIGNTVVGISVPLGVFKITPSDFIGSYTGIRTLLMQLSEAAMSMLLGIFILKIPLTLTLIFTLILVLSIAYFAKLAFTEKQRYAEKIN
jgi:hypothetical protein